MRFDAGIKQKYNTNKHLWLLICNMTLITVAVDDCVIWQCFGGVQLTFGANYTII